VASNIEEKLKRALDSDRWLFYLCYFQEGTLFFEFESHNFPEVELRKVKHQPSCHLREAIENADAKTAKSSGATRPDAATPPAA
jgi:hypothetical protein